MTKFRIYSVWDKVSDESLSVFPSPNAETAKRNIRMALKSPQMMSSPLCQSPGDFELIELCEVDGEDVEVIRKSLGCIPSFAYMEESDQN